MKPFEVGETLIVKDTTGHNFELGQEVVLVQKVVQLLEFSGVVWRGGHTYSLRQVLFPEQLGRFTNARKLHAAIHALKAELDACKTQEEANEVLGPAGLCQVLAERCSVTVRVFMRSFLGSDSYYNMLGEGGVYNQARFETLHMLSLLDVLEIDDLGEFDGK